MLEVSELKLNLITAISSSDQEEMVASFLFSQGCNIIFRAITSNSLISFLKEQKIPVSILYSKEFDSKAELQKIFTTFKQHHFLEISESFDSSHLLSELAEITRPPLFHQLLRLSNCVTLIGSPDSPGVSTVANHLTRKISANLITPTHHNLRPTIDCEVHQIPASAIGEKIEEFGKKLIVIDGGGIISLTKMLADRRINAQWVSQSMSCSKFLIYVVKSEDNGISYLSEFLKDFTNLVSAPNLICVLNQQRFDKSGQNIQKRFLSITGSHSTVMLPYDIRAIRAVTPSPNKYLSWRDTAFNKQIAKIGRHLT